MAHANTAFVLEVDARSYTEAKNLVNRVAEESDRVETVKSYPDNPHQDSLLDGFNVKIDGNRYNWSYSSSAGGEYEGNREGLGFYLQEKTKKYGGRTSISEASDVTEAFEHFGSVAERVSGKFTSVEGYVTVVTV